MALDVECKVQIRVWMQGALQADIWLVSKSLIESKHTFSVALILVSSAEIPKANCSCTCRTIFSNIKVSNDSARHPFCEPPRLKVIYFGCMWWPLCTSFWPDSPQPCFKHSLIFPIWGIYGTAVPRAWWTLSLSQDSNLNQAGEFKGILRPCTWNTSELQSASRNSSSHSCREETSGASHRDEDLDPLVGKTCKGDVEYDTESNLAPHVLPFSQTTKLQLFSVYHLKERFVVSMLARTMLAWQSE